MNKHVRTLFRYWFHEHQAPGSTDDNLALLEAVKWAAGQRGGARVPDGRLVFIDWKDDPAHIAMHEELSK